MPSLKRILSKNDKNKLLRFSADKKDEFNSTVKNIFQQREEKEKRRRKEEKRNIQKLRKTIDKTRSRVLWFK